MTSKTSIETVKPVPSKQVNPPRNCTRCPRLATFRQENGEKHPDWFNGPAPSFGPPNAKLLIVGLAPGLQGANRTGRPFTGDFAGDLLYATLAKFGLSHGSYAASPDDGLQLVDTMITNAVRCVPPQNKPVGAEIKQCRPYLINQINNLRDLRAILCLGRIAHDSTLDALGIRKKDAPFGHGARHVSADPSVAIYDSYHCSRYNTNTRRLTEQMFEGVFAEISAELEKAA